MNNVIPQQEPRKVWEVLADSCNLSEATARKICHDFHNEENEIFLPADGNASEFATYIAGMYSWLENPDIRNAILAGEEVTGQVEDNTDPFYYAVKVDPNVVHKHLAPVKQIIEPITCSICQDTAENPARLSCKCAFCKECIVSWITLSCAKCPNCRNISKEHVVPIRATIRCKPPVPAVVETTAPEAPANPTVNNDDPTVKTVNEIMRGKTKIIIALKSKNQPPSV